MRIQFDLELRGVMHHVDSDAMTLTQYAAIEAVSGLVFAQLFDGVVQKRTKAMRALAWLLDGMTGDYGAIDFPLSDWKLTNLAVAEDDDPKEPQPGQPALDGLDLSPNT